MFIQMILDNVFNFAAWVISCIPIVTLPTLDVSTIVVVIAAASGILPMEVLGAVMVIFVGFWAARGCMLAVRWILWVVQLVWP